MMISIVLNRANKSWIIEKIANRLRDELLKQGVVAVVAETADSHADVVHHMSWAFAHKTSAKCSTMFITHLDDAHKQTQVRKTLTSGTVGAGICMSSDTMRQLVKNGTRANQLTYILPAHDGDIKPRRIVIGLTTRLYADGRKRETLLLDAASTLDLSPFEFRIFGNGWKTVVPLLEKAGASVKWHEESADYQNDYSAMLAAIPHFDYYLYLGLDEGSLGTLDALCAGVKTIVTPQGFHLDLPNGISHSVVTGADLITILQGIADERQSRVEAVSGLSWSHYARQHLDLWSTMASGQEIAAKLQGPVPPESDFIRMNELRELEMTNNSRSMRRLLSHASHHPALRPLRRMVDLVRLKR